MKTISIIMPAIRTDRWDDFYRSLEASCAKHSFELCIASPFALTDFLKTKNNIVYLHTYAQPSRAGQQLVVQGATGKLMFLTVDDGLFMPDALDIAIDHYKAVGNYRDVMNMRYKEGKDYSGTEKPMEYWKAGTWEEFHLEGIQSNWEISVQPMMERKYFLELGGWDCQFEYLNHSCHDLMFRIQADGGKIIQSPTSITTADWMEGTTGDHAPIHHAQLSHDQPLFREIYRSFNAAKRRKIIQVDNWKNCPEVWTRRFTSKSALPKTYKEYLLCV